MACQELLELRKQATKLTNQMNDQRKIALAKAAHTRQGRPSGESEYLPFLRRKLSRLSESIERHISQHGCQE